MASNVVIAAPTGTTVVRWGNTPTPADPPTLVLSIAPTGTTGVAASGTITNTGTIDANWTLTSSPFAYVTGGGGVIPPGGVRTFTITTLVAGAHVLTLTNDSGGSVVGSPATFTASDASTPVDPPTGTEFTTLTVYNPGAAGTYPFSATVLPLIGECPSGSSLYSADEPDIRASILGTHSDGSASVVVVAGTVTAPAAGTRTVSIHAGTAIADTALTAAAISARVTSVEVDFDAYGVGTITDFSTPEKTWWANSKTICARYRVAAPSPGSTALEAVIDIQAWSDRALVEVVVENATVDCTLSTVTKPAAANYTGATVSVNGTTVATVNSSAVPTEAAHSWSRAFYAKAWVGTDPGLRAHQTVADLQEHPLLFKMDQASTADLSGYATDAYSVWGNGRLPAAYMGNGGDATFIGPLTKWDAQWLQSGDYRAANATEQNALCALSFNINSRSQATGLVPTFTEIDLKSFNGNNTWPVQSNGSNALQWELMHHPATGLAAFLVRPSPVFIEIAQKVAVWNAMYVTNFDRSTVQPTGVFRGGGSTTRGRGWGLRSLAHAIFLTPDGDAWKTPAKTNLAANVTYLDGYRTSVLSKLGVTWEGDPDLPTSTDFNTGAGGAGFAIRQWFYSYLLCEVHKIASAKILTGADQTAISTLADWMCTYPVRWINEQTDGGWRYIPYSTIIGRDSSSAMSQDATWDLIRDWAHSDSPSTVAGTWYFSTGEPTTYASGYNNTDSNRPRYVDYFWSALVAAVERGVDGAVAAWQTVQANVTNLSTWRAGFGLEPRWGSTPKSGTGWASGAGTGSYNSGTYTWTPATTAGVVNSASWAIVPTGVIVKVAGSNLSAIDAEVRAAATTWNTSQLDWSGLTNSYSGVLYAPAVAKAWLMGGGHSNGTNNGVYRFDLYKMAWTFERAPSNRSGWAGVGYPGSSSTEYGPSATQAIADIAGSTWTAINGSYYDQLQDGRPTGRHTYASMAYDSSRQQLIFASRRLWRFDLTSQDWIYKRAVNDISTGAKGPTLGGDDYLDAEESIGTYDEVADEYLTSSNGSAGHRTGIIYQLTPQTWNTTLPNFTWNGSTVFTTRKGRKWVMWRGSDGSYDNGRYWVYDLDTRTNDASGVEVQYSGGLTRGYFAFTGNYKDPALAWVPPLNAYLLLINTTVGGWEFFKLDPTTTPYTLSKYTAWSGALPTLTDNMRGRMTWDDAINALLFFAQGDQSCAVLRF